MEPDLVFALLAVGIIVAFVSRVDAYKRRQRLKQARQKHDRHFAEWRAYKMRVARGEQKPIKRVMVNCKSEEIGRAHV